MVSACPLISEQKMFECTRPLRDETTFKGNYESIFTEDVDIEAAKSIIRLLTVRSRLLEEC